MSLHRNTWQNNLREGILYKILVSYLKDCMLSTLLSSSDNDRENLPSLRCKVVTPGCDRELNLILTAFDDKKTYRALCTYTFLHFYGETRTLFHGRFSRCSARTSTVMRHCRVTRRATVVHHCLSIELKSTLIIRREQWRPRTNGDRTYAQWHDGFPAF